MIITNEMKAAVLQIINGQTPKELLQFAHLSGEGFWVDTLYTNNGKQEVYRQQADELLSPVKPYLGTLRSVWAIRQFVHSMEDKWRADFSVEPALSRELRDIIKAAREGGHTNTSSYDFRTFHSGVILEHLDLAYMEELDVQNHDDFMSLAEYLTGTDGWQCEFVPKRMEDAFRLLSASDPFKTKALENAAERHEPLTARQFAALAEAMEAIDAVFSDTVPAAASNTEIESAYCDLRCAIQRRLAAAVPADPAAAVLQLRMFMEDTEDENPLYSDGRDRVLLKSLMAGLEHMACHSAHQAAE